MSPGASASDAGSTDEQRLAERVVSAMMERDAFSQWLGIEVLTVVSAIEEEFGITFEDEDLKVAHFATVGALVTFVEGRVR